MTERNVQQSSSPFELASEAASLEASVEALIVSEPAVKLRSRSTLTFV